MNMRQQPAAKLNNYSRRGQRGIENYDPLS